MGQPFRHKLEKRMPIMAMAELPFEKSCEESINSSTGVQPFQ
jgi:hypothetical protein